MGYAREAIKGVSWTGGTRVFIRAISFGRTIILARILTPMQFGFFGIATIVLSLLEILTETGINIFLIQKKENIDQYINTAWSISILRGLVIGFIIFLGASPIASFFNTNKVYPLLLIASLIPCIRGFINPSVVKFVKDLRFNLEFFYRSSIFFVESIAGLLLVLFLNDVSGLLWGLVIGAFFEVFLSFVMIRPIPVPRFSWAYFFEIIGKGKWMTFTGIFGYLYYNVDDIVIGKLLGASSLGFYDMAYKLSLLPMTEVSDVVMKVTLPLFVKISDDTVRLKRAFFRSFMVMSFFVIPLSLVLSLFPQQIIVLILGKQWVAAADVLRILAIFGAVRALSLSVFSPFYAKQKQEIITVITLISLIGLSVTIVPFVSLWGMVGGAYSSLFGLLLSIPIILFSINKLFKSHGKTT